MTAAPGLSSGDTLVDVLGLINPWNIVQSTIDKVKSVANDVLDGIKAAGQFIADAVLSVIHGALATIGRSAIFAVFTAINEILSLNYDVTMNGDSVKVADSGNTLLDLDVSSNSKGLYLDTGDGKLSLHSPLFSPLFDVKFETLSVFSEANWVGAESAIVWALAMLAISTSISYINPYSLQAWGLVAGIVLGLYTGSIVNEILTYKDLTGNDKSLYKDRMINFHLSLTFTLIYSILDRAGNDWSSQVNHNTKPSSFPSTANVGKTSKAMQNKVLVGKMGPLVSSVDSALASNWGNLMFLAILASEMLDLGIQAVDLSSISPTNLSPEDQDKLVTLGFGFGGGFVGLLPKIVTSLVHKNNVKGGKTFDGEHHPKTNMKSYAPILLIMSLIHLSIVLLYQLVL